MSSNFKTDAPSLVRVSSPASIAERVSGIEQRIQGSGVSSVNGKVGTVILSTDDIGEGLTNLYYTDGRVDARIGVQKASPNGLATLDGAGKIPINQIPATAITDTYVVNSQAAMLALPAQTGDIAIRTDINATFILQGSDPTMLSNWQELLFPGGGVNMVNGQTGPNVVLTTSDIAEGTNLYYTSGRFDSAFSGKSTSDLTEGSNLYYTQGRFDSAFSGKSTSNLAEGSNLYFTSARFDSSFAGKTTDNLSEGSTNLYFLNSRARAAISSTGVISYSPSTGIISITQAGTAQDGYLTQTDWNTFNNKVPAARAINTTAPLSGGGNLGADLTILMSQSSGSSDGYLSQVDWTTFNNKAPIDSPAFTGIPTAPTAGVGTSTTQLATTAFVLSQGFTGASGSIPFAHQSSTSVSTSATTTYVTAITTTINVTATSAPVYVKGTATLTTTASASVAKYRVTVNGVAGQEQLLSLTATATDYTAAVQYISTALTPGAYTITFDIARNSGTGTVNFIQGTLDGIALQGAASNGITQLTGDITAGPGSGSQAATIVAGAVTNAKVAAAAAIAFSKLAALPSTNILVGNASNAAAAVAMSGDATISNTGALTIAANAITSGKIAAGAVTLTSKVGGILPYANGGTGATTFASGRVPFSGATALATNGSFLFDTANVRLTVGTGGGSGTLNVVPTVGASTLGLNVFSNTANHSIQVQNQAAMALEMINANAGGGGQFTGCLMRATVSQGTLIARTQAKNGDQVWRMSGLAYYDGSNTGGETNYIQFALTEDYTVTNQGGEINFGTTPNGTTASVLRLKLTNRGEAVFSSAIATARYSTANKNALTPTGGWVVFDTDLNQLSYYNGTTWVNL